MEPLEAYGVQAMSIGFLIDVETPMVWRGPMVTQALEQMLNETELEGPRLSGGRHAAGHRRHATDAGAEGAGDRRGGGDDAAGHRADRRAQGPEDVREGGRAHPRHRREHEHPRLLELRPRRTHLRHRRRRGDVQDYNVDFLGSLPLELGIREMADSGKPTVVGAPDSKAADIYRAIARRVAVKVGETAKDMSSKFPSIVVQNT